MDISTSVTQQYQDFCTQHSRLTKKRAADLEVLESVRNEMFVESFFVAHEAIEDYYAPKIARAWEVMCLFGDLLAN